MVNCPLPLLNSAKQPSAFCSSKYFFKELSVVTLLELHAASKQAVKTKRKKRMLIKKFGAKVSAGRAAIFRSKVLFQFGPETQRSQRIHNVHNNFLCAPWCFGVLVV